MNKLIIAAAGAGKTTHLVNEALKIASDKVLITTFTESNEQEIKKKIFELNGCIPSNIIVQTWFSFLIQQGVKPYQSFLYENKVTGLLLVNKKSGLKYCYNGKPVYYRESEVAQHYFTNDGRIYSDKLSKFVYKLNEINSGITIDRITRIYKYIFIDEVQDLAGYDLEIVDLLSRNNTNLLMIGDPRQVTYHTHEEAKNHKYSEGNIEDFIKERNLSIFVDKTTLNITHRNEKRICNFANTIYPEFPPCSAKTKEATGHDGVFFVHAKDVESYLEKYKPIQLRGSKKVNVNDKHPVMNFGDAKGLTFNRVIIYPTTPMQEWIFNHNKDLKPKSRARLYVAVTRAKYSVAIVITKSKNVDGISVWES